MDEELCLDVFEEAVEKYGAPDTINTDLGTQYTGDAWAKPLERLEASSAKTEKAVGQIISTLKDSGERQNTKIFFQMIVKQLQN